MTQHWTLDDSIVQSDKYDKLALQLAGYVYLCVKNTYENTFKIILHNLFSLHWNVNQSINQSWKKRTSFLTSNCLKNFDQSLIYSYLQNVNFHSWTNFVFNS